MEMGQVSELPSSSNPIRGACGRWRTP